MGTLNYCFIKMFQVIKENPTGNVEETLFAQFVDPGWVQTPKFWLNESKKSAAKNLFKLKGSMSKNNQKVGFVGKNRGSSQITPKSGEINRESLQTIAPKSKTSEPKSKIKLDHYGIKHVRNTKIPIKNKEKWFDEIKNI